MKFKFFKAAVTSLILSSSFAANAGLILDADFDPTAPADWVISNGSVLGNPSSEFISQNALHFDGTGARSAITGSFDMTTGGLLSFLLKIGGPNDTSTFENADSGEDVLIQYSANNGVWVDLLLIDTEDLNYRDVWGLVSLDITGLAMTSNTRFQWSQVTHSGTAFDNWAIDNVKLTNNASVPEPSTLAIFALGLMGLVSRRFKR